MSFFDDASLVMIPSGYKNQKVYSVKPTDGTGDLTFSRASSATRVQSDGLIEKVRTNLLLNSATFVTQTVTVTGNPHTISFTGTGTIVITGTGSGTLVGTGAANRVSLSFTTTAGSLILTGTGTVTLAQLETGDIATDYIATTATAVSVGPVSGLPRLDYLGSTCPRLLLEPQRSNLVQYSEQFDNAAWQKNNLTITANNLVSPDGYTNADTALETATNAFHDLIQNPSLTSGTTYTLSSFVKAAGRDYCYLFLSDGITPAAVKFNLATGVVLGTATGSPVSSKIENYGNGWYRCSMVYTSGATATGTLAISATNSPALSLSGYAGDITKGIAVYGAQLEAGAYATSYIPTLGASVTRVADAASKTGISALIGQTEGTLFVDFVLNGRQNNANILSSEKNITASFFIGALTDNTIDAGLYASGVDAARITGGSVSVGQRAKIAYAYKSGSSALYINGALIGTSSGTFTLPSTLDDIFLNDVTTYFNYQENVSFNQALLFKTRLTNAQLAELTA